MDHSHMAAIFLRRHTQGGKLKFWDNVVLLCSRLKVISGESHKLLVNV